MANILISLLWRTYSLILSRRSAFSLVFSCLAFEDGSEILYYVVFEDRNALKRFMEGLNSGGTYPSARNPSTPGSNGFEWVKIKQLEEIKSKVFYTFEEKKH